MRRRVQKNSTASTSTALKDSVFFGKKCSRESLEHVVQLLQTKHNCDVKLSVTSDFKLVGIFLQDDEMKQMFEAFPEILIIDASQEFKDLNIPLFMFIVEDGNGISEVVAIGVFVLSDEATFRWFVDSFRENNPSFTKTCITVCNKHFTEREIIKEKFPDALHTLSLPHVLEEFHQKIISREMGISERKQSDYMQAFENMCYSSSVTKYRQEYDTFKTIAPKKLAKYFKSKWHHHRSEWIVSLIFGSGNFVDKSHNRLPIFKSKIKVISSFVTLYEFVDKLFTILPGVRNEGHKLASCEIEKLSSENYEIDSAEDKYSKLLTPYALKLILNQLSLSSKMDLIQSNNGHTLSAENKLCVTGNTCNCTFFQCMNLPCKHFFALQQKLNASKFKKELCGLRWHRDYYCERRKIDLQRIKSIPSSRSTLNAAENRPLSMNDKFRGASIISAEIAALISQSSSDVDFQEKIDFLEALFTNWREGKKVKVQEEIEASGAQSHLSHPTCQSNENTSTNKSDDNIAEEKSNISAGDDYDETKKSDTSDDDIEMEDCTVTRDNSNSMTQQSGTVASNDNAVLEDVSAVDYDNSVPKDFSADHYSNIVMVDPENMLYAYEVEI